MKYLRKFNESALDDYNNERKSTRKTLEENVRTNLAYLLDNEDWVVFVSDTMVRWEKGKPCRPHVKREYHINIRYGDNEFKEELFKFSDMKTMLLPFLEMMMDEYDMDDEFRITYLDIKRNIINYDEKYSLAELEDLECYIKHIIFSVRIGDEKNFDESGNEIGWE